MEFDANDSSCSSSSSSSMIASADVQGTQLYFFEPYNGEASSDSANELDEGNTDW